MSGILVEWNGVYRLVAACDRCFSYTLLSVFLMEFVVYS